MKYEPKNIKIQLSYRKSLLTTHHFFTVSANYLISASPSHYSICKNNKIKTFQTKTATYQKSLLDNKVPNNTSIGTLKIISQGFNPFSG